MVHLLEAVEVCECAAWVMVGKATQLWMVAIYGSSNGSCCVQDI